LNTIEIEEGSRLSVIEEGAFHFSGLQCISLPQSVEYLGDCCFNESYFLSKINICEDSKLTRIGSKCFRWTNIEEIVIPESVEIVGAKALDHCQFLKKVNFRGCFHLQTIPEFCFGFCNELCTVTFESELLLKSIESFAFCESSLSQSYSSFS
jgi:hypothetical protein